MLAWLTRCLRVQFLNLRLNFLSSVKGIQKLSKLRKLDIRWNPRLNVKKTLKKLAGCTTTTLAEVSIAPSEVIAVKPACVFGVSLCQDAATPHHPCGLRYQHSILLRLLPVHRQLRLLEGRLISPSQRIRVWRNKLKWDNAVRVFVRVSTMAQLCRQRALTRVTHTGCFPVPIQPRRNAVSGPRGESKLPP